MTSDERVSQLTGELNQSTESVGEILRTNERTYEDSYSLIDLSLTYVPRGRVQPIDESEGLRAPTAPATPDTTTPPPCTAGGA